jgi:hypothetical protein
MARRRRPLCRGGRAVTPDSDKAPSILDVLGFLGLMVLASLFYLWMGGAFD